MRKLPDNVCTYWLRQQFRECDDFGCSPYSVMSADQAERHHEALEREDDADPPCGHCDACAPWPDVVFLGHVGGLWQFELRGGPVDASWAARLTPPEAAWCKITVCASDTHATIMGAVVTGWGGSVWPNAWPDLMQPTPGGKGYTLSNEGTHVLHEAMLDARDGSKS